MARVQKYLDQRLAIHARPDCGRSQPVLESGGKPGKDLGLCRYRTSRGEVVSLRGRGILVTGASQGFGRAVAEACVDAGANVFLCARSVAELEETRRTLRARAAQHQVVGAEVADVSDPDAASQLIGAATRQLPRFTGLVNNAGIYGPKGCIEDVAWKDWVQAIEINLFGSVLLCRAAIPIFRRQGYGKIGQSLRGRGYRSYAWPQRLCRVQGGRCAIDGDPCTRNRGGGFGYQCGRPGALNTRMLGEVLATGPEKVGQTFFDKAVQQKANGGAPLEKGAALCVYLLSAASDGISGRLLSAIWDPWQSLASRSVELGRSDIYTLRRIVPQDRGLNWEQS
jgi:short chain dehydrogenase